jgi:hypothetical protein
MKIKKILPKNFNPKAYLDLNPDVANNGVDPEYHYLNYGINEGRKYNYTSSIDLFRGDSSNKEHFIENEYTNKYAYLNPINIGGSAWTGHAYFVNFLVSIIKVKTFVELGIHYGFSYFNICRVMEILKSEYNDCRDSKAYGIDSFEGDVHAVFNEDGNNIEKHVNKLNINFSYFSKIIRSKFDDACLKFENKSIDLLHIDGQHLYKDVKNDFKKWKDKLSDNSVVLFHDTQIKSRDFGVYKFWDEIKDNYPTINFQHSAGLGVLFYGKKINKRTENFIEFISNKNNKKIVINFYKNMHFLTNLHSNVYLLEKSKKENIIQNVEYVKSHRTKIAIISDEIYQSNFDVRLKNIFEFYQKKRNSVIINYFYESLFEPELIDYYDVFIFSRLLIEEQSLNLIEIIKKKRKKIIYDIDDYLIGKIPKFLNYHSSGARVEITKQLITQANLITVGTNEMQKKLNLLNNNTYVFPNGIDGNFIDNKDKDDNEDSGHILNIVLASTDTVDISMLSEPLKQILDQNHCQLNVIGPISDQVKQMTNHANVFFHENMSYHEFLFFLQKQKNTIGFIPLDNSEFSNCKTPIKYIHYSSLGIPCICSNVKPYNEIIKNEFDGFLANNTQDWISYFNILKNKNTRKQITDNAKKNIIENYTYDSLILKIDEILKKVL